MEIADAFRYVADFGRISEWDPGVAESGRLTRGAVGEGSRFRVVVRAGLGHTEMEYVIREFDPPRRVLLRPFFANACRYQFGNLHFILPVELNVILTHKMVAFFTT